MRELHGFFNNTRYDLAAEITNKVNLASEELSEVRKCSTLFEALNLLWNDFYKFRKSLEQLTEAEKEKGRASDSQSFFQLLLRGIQEGYQKNLCVSNELKCLAELEPKILNHDILIEENYDPQNIPDELNRKAQKEHNKLKNAYLGYIESEDPAQYIEPLLKKLKTLLYVVRSNIAHGEKTPRGPDRNKEKRDRQVCNIIYPLLNLIFEYIFDGSSKRLATYGTLAPSEPNEKTLAKIDGTWSEGYVRGEISIENDYKFFKWDVEGEKIKIKVFESFELLNIFHKIDVFEGKLYKRIVIPVETCSGIKVSNIYIKSKNQNY